MALVFSTAGRRVRMPRWAAWLVTMTFVTTSWLYFYEVDPGQLLAKSKSLVAPAGYLGNPLGELLRLAGSHGDVIYLAAAVAAGAVVVAFEGLSRRWSSGPYNWAMPAWPQAAMVALIVWASPLENNGFVYFNF
jgi:hypothetical protein